MTHEQLKYKLDQYLSDTLPREDFPAFWDSLQVANAEGVWQDAIEKVLQNESLHGLSDKEAKSEILMDIQGLIQPQIKTPPAHRIHFLKTTWFRYAAVILLIAGTATALYISSQLSRSKPNLTAQKTTDKPTHIAPGGNKAVLTLTDGSTIVLDSAADGNLAQQGGTKIIKLNAGALAYRADIKDGKPGYNVLRTPKGGQYQITLPDGTRVWLNSASSVRFPTAFTGNERRIEITGEAYLEIARQAVQPFIVESGNTNILVLSTSFNINSYQDEPEIKTTLIQGSIKVVKGTGSVLLKEGQQARTTATGSSAIQVQTADIERVIAWKEGYFNFNGADIKSVMREIGRWYDLDIVYEGEPGNPEIMGEIGRKLNLSQVMDVMKNLNIKYRLEGRKLIVLQ